MNKNDDIFIRPVMRGKRFEDHTVPVDVLPELPVYRDFVVALAKKLFLRRHPNRQRVPKGFSERLQLTVGDIEDNCATPVLLRKPADQTSQQGRLEFEGDVFIEARDMINDTIQSVGEGKTLPDEFPEDMLPWFKRLGAKLRKDEAIDFTKPGQSSGAHYTSATRQALLAITEDEYEESITVEGTVTRVDTSASRFDVETEDLGTVSVDLSGQYERDILDAHRFYRSRSVRVIGSGLFAAIGELRKVRQIETLEIEDKAPDYASRLDDLATIEDDWLNGEQGKATPPELVEALRNGIPELVAAENLPNPYIYPVIEGGLRLEWDLCAWEIEAEFLPSGDLKAFACNLETDDDDDYDSRWDQKNSFSKLAGFIARFLTDTEE